MKNLICKIFWHSDLKYEYDIVFKSKYLETTNYSYKCKRCWRIEKWWMTEIFLNKLNNNEIVEYIQK